MVVVVVAADRDDGDLRSQHTQQRRQARVLGPVMRNLEHLE